MYPIAPQLDALPMLYEQHRLYTEELGKTHAGLSRLYKKLAKVERKLNGDGECRPSRTQAKKLWWSRTVAKQSIEKLEAQKNSLYSLLQQCRDLITSYSHGAYCAPATSFWTMHFPPTPFGVTPFTPFPETPWTAGPYCALFVGQQLQQPQYWDLSMLNENRAVLSTGSGCSDVGITHARMPEHVFAHELSNSTCSAVEAAFVNSGSLNGCERNDATEMPKPIMIDTDRANALHKRRYSENTVSACEQHPKGSGSQQRGVSAAPGRTATDPELHTVSQEDTLGRCS